MRAVIISSMCNFTDNVFDILIIAHEDSIQSNWGEFTTWLCGILLSLYCIQRPKIWNKLAKSDTVFNINS